MPLQENSPAPDFSLPSTEGKTLHLHQDLKGKALVLYFYPKDFTPKCTQEACEFRDQFNFFRKQDILVYGISRDDLATHERFRKEHKLPFHLLADEKGEVAKKYKATIPLLPVTRRITYLLDKNHTVAGVFEKMFGAEEHIQAMIEKVKAAEAAV